MKVEKISGSSISLDSFKFDKQKGLKDLEKVNTIIKSKLSKRKKFSFRLILRDESTKNPAYVDMNNKQKGFIYVGLICEKGKFEIGNNAFIKIGVSKNPIFRILSHKRKTFKDKSFTVQRITDSLDYLKCEAEIKKLTNGKEIFPYNKNLKTKIDKIITNYADNEIDIPTFNLLTNVDSLKNFKFK